MNGLEQVLSKAVALPTGVTTLGELVLLVMGLALVAGGVHCWVRWRKLTK